MREIKVQGGRSPGTRSKRILIVKKTYEKPTLSKREKLSRVTAGIPLSQQA